MVFVGFGLVFLPHSTPWLSLVQLGAVVRYGTSQVSVVLALAVSTISCDSSLAPLGQARLSVSTDAEIGTIVTRLRVDFFDENLGWFDSREAALPDKKGWPASFIVYGRDAEKTSRVTLRLRAYADGAVRDYRGERFIPTPPKDTPPGAVASVPDGDGPRLLRDGIDVTPNSEPLPDRAIDRLVTFTLREGETKDLRITLGVECAGTMSDLQSLRTCTSARGEIAPVVPDPPSDPAPEEARWIADNAAAFAHLPTVRTPRTAKDGTPLHNEEVRIPGGAFVLGSRELAAMGTLGGGGRVLAEPERVFIEAPFLIDRFEVTVARFRDATERGLVVDSLPFANDGPLMTDVDEHACTFSTIPITGSSSREELPLNCVEWQTARAFCLFEGGDLPTEAEWEFVATRAGQERKMSFPWGNDSDVTCDDVVYGRAISDLELPCASSQPVGPLVVTAGKRDETPLGVHGLIGNLSEHVMDSYYPYDSACWASQPARHPLCTGDFPVTEGRGGDWRNELFPATFRAGAGRFGSSWVGFRCVRH